VQHILLHPTDIMSQIPFGTCFSVLRLPSIGDRGLAIEAEYSGASSSTACFTICFAVEFELLHMSL
jgi:hypothetical protein